MVEATEETAAPAAEPKKAKAAKKGAKKEPAKKSKRAKKAPSSPNPSATDSTGKHFDAGVHAAETDGTPVKDSAGRFIRKELHYQAPKKAHYPDSFRHH